MKSFSLLSPPLLYLHLLFLLTLNLIWSGPNKIRAVAAIGNQTDHLALLKFKESITSDPYKALESWNSSIHFCKWQGITCSPMHERVTKLSLERYQLHGSLSPHVSNLTFLKTLDILNNNFFGEIPQELGQLLHLQQLFLSNNSFVGEIPTNLTYCSNLRLLYVWNNNLTGKIPSFIGNLSCLTRLSASRNNFEGDIPQEICFLKHLTFLALGENNLSGKIPSCIYNISSLIGLAVPQNNFGGHLSNSIGNLSTELKQLLLGGNQISGKIPAELGCLDGLILLTMDYNFFEGIIPTTFGKFQKMQVLYLRENKLSGDIPPFIGNLSQLFDLELDHNMFQGIIPPSLGNCQNLQYLDLSHNKLRGTIPVEVLNLFSLSILLNLSHNSLSGTLPREVGMLKNIEALDVSENHLSGDIPREIGECTSLEYIHLQRNIFNGTIPSSLASLKGLRYLDLSRNQLSGSIPDGMQNISVLDYLNVSFNMLEGEVPTNGVFGNATQIEVIGNKKLCGGISHLHLPPCPIKGRKHAKQHKFRLIAVIVSVVSFTLILSLIITIYMMRKRNQKRTSDSPTIDQLAKVSYQELHVGTDGFSDRNMIGSGSFGSVYKGNIVSEDNVVAVKVLNLQKKGAHKSFIAECNALKNIRHRNLVKVLTCCSSTNYKGQEFKALVFEYMKNGSLEQWLHPEILNANPPTTLNLGHRLNIIIDVASALHYLHRECEQLILHCDLKPSNVLLDDDMVAHVSDFGIARLVSTISGTTNKNTSTIGIKGTVGYAPLEYGMGSEVSTCGDMYSFGILMLEMLTGRRPTDELFEDGENLHNFVTISFPDNLIKILDPHLLPRAEEGAREDGNHEILIPTVEECLVSLFRIGLLCSLESPKERMNIVDVTRELSTIQKVFLAGHDQNF